MNALSDLQLRHSYHKGINDIATEFYLPCMERAVAYDRAVAFFSSTVYIIAWPALKGFVARGGRIRVVTSPSLSPEDAAAIEGGYYVRSNAELARLLEGHIRRLLDLPRLNKPTRVLATLVALGVLDIRIAALEDPIEPRYRRFFHDKVGIFRDTVGNTVVFKGSMNESWLGLANDGNLESVDVYVSWADERERERVIEEADYFERLWTNEYPTVRVWPFPEAARLFLHSIAEKEQWQFLVDEIVQELEGNTEARGVVVPTVTGDLRLRPHQVEALRSWMERGRRGILQHATGSGKTLTALAAIRDAVARGETPVVVVPSRILLEQWSREIRKALGSSSLSVLKCGAGNTRWRAENLVDLWTRPVSTAQGRLVLVTVQTAAKEAFLSQVRPGSHVFLVADEVHTLGSPQHRRILSLQSGPRLGLSATPERFGDPDGTQAIMEYFGGIIPPVYSLSDAIRDGILTPYWYEPHPVYLTESEQAQWEELSERVRQLYARLQAKGDRDEGAQLEERMRLLLIERARLAKSAVNKVALAVSIVSTHWESGQRWIVYCETVGQLREVRSALNRAGYTTLEYHMDMRGDRTQTLGLFEQEGGILLAIRCLDEGVDIPAVTHAVILASSRNPRQFIQRRGRVLRRAQGKTLAYIHDAIVVPRRPLEGAQVYLPMWSLLEAEMARAIEFAQYSINPGGAAELRRIAVRYGFDLERLAKEGYEE